MGCVFDLYMDESFSNKLIKNHLLVANVSETGYGNKLVTDIWQLWACLQTDYSWQAYLKSLTAGKILMMVLAVMFFHFTVL